MAKTRKARGAALLITCGGEACLHTARMHTGWGEKPDTALLVLGRGSTYHAVSLPPLLCVCLSQYVCLCFFSFCFDICTNSHR